MYIKAIPKYSVPEHSIKLLLTGISGKMHTINRILSFRLIRVLLSTETPWLRLMRHPGEYMVHHNTEASWSVTSTGILVSDSSGHLEHREDTVAVEEPLQIVLKQMGKSTDFAVIMRTPGFDFELAAGFLFSEGIIKKKSEISSISYGKSGQTDPQNVVVVEVAGNVEIRTEGRNFSVNSSCGVCGKSSINSIFLKGSTPIRTATKLDREMINRLPGILAEKQRVFRKTGGIHAAGLFDFTGNLLLVREDVGRHNAVDRIVGHILMNEMIGGDDYILQVSGRTGFEIVQKAAMAGIPVVSSISAPTSLAVETARAFNITLACFVRNGKFNIYSHEERLEG